MELLRTLSERITLDGIRFVDGSSPDARSAELLMVGEFEEARWPKKTIPLLSDSEK